MDSLIIYPSGIINILKTFNTCTPLEVDVGCGKGRFLSARAERNHNINFLGIDRQLSRIKKVERKIVNRKICNVRLIRMEISYVIEKLLPPLSVSVFYIFFPDPWPKRKHYKRRLFSEPFISSLLNTLIKKGKVHFITDHLDYFQEVCNLFSKNSGFKSITAFEPTPDERTDFELTFLKQRKKISRASFQKI